MKDDDDDVPALEAVTDQNAETMENNKTATNRNRVRLATGGHASHYRYRACDRREIEECIVCHSLTGCVQIAEWYLVKPRVKIRRSKPCNKWRRANKRVIRHQRRRRLHDYSVPATADISPLHLLQLWFLNTICNVMHFVVFVA